MKWAVGAFLLFVLFITHALVGAVELGTDGWIQNITGNILTSEQGKILFVFTSMMMFGLRFCASWIEEKLGQAFLRSNWHKTAARTSSSR